MKRKAIVPFNCKMDQADGDGPVTFTGYASTFGNVDLGGDIVMPGAFRKFLERKERTVKMLWNHDSFGIPIGKWLDIQEDEIGLKVVGELTPGLALASDVGAAMKHGTIEAMSIGYGVREWSKGDNDERKLEEIELFEISPVNFPMNESAIIAGVKHLIDQIDDLKSAEKLLRESAGFSANAATDFICRVKRIARREVEGEIRSENEIDQLRDTVLESLKSFNMRIK